MAWPINRRRRDPNARRSLSDDDRRLVDEAVAAGRVTVCPTAFAPQIGSALPGRMEAGDMAADILRVERAG